MCIFEVLIQEKQVVLYVKTINNIGFGGKQYILTTTSFQVGDEELKDIHVSLTDFNNVIITGQSLINFI